MKALETRIMGGYFYERIKYLKKISGNDKILKQYLEYCKYVYWHGGNNCKYNSLFDTDREYVEIEGMKLPCLRGNDIGNFWVEFPDVLLPYILELRGNKYKFEMIEPLMVEGPYELNEDVSVDKDDVVIDCGANIGLFSAIASDKGARVYSFEPNEDVIETYLYKTKGYRGNINIVPLALSNECGEMYFDKNTTTNSSGTGHLVSDAKESDVVVKTTTLDKFVENQGLNRVDFIKADIEGAERDMLKGATNVLREFAPKLSICTYHLPDDKEVLEDIVKSANPNYVIEHRYKKMYGYVPKKLRI